MMSKSDLLNFLTSLKWPKGVSCVILGGSQIYSPDSFSDYDIGIFWTRFPTLKQRKKLLTHFLPIKTVDSLLLKKSKSHLGLSDNIYFEGNKIDLIHLSHSQALNAKNLVSSCRGLFLFEQALLWNIKYGKVLFGQRPLKIHYTKKLSKYYIRTLKQQIYLPDIQKAKFRKDDFFVRQQLAQNEKIRFLIKLARMNTFFVSFKQTDNQLKFIKR